MKVTRKPEATFQPFSLTLEVESAGEQKMLHTLCKLDVSIPDLVRECPDSQIDRDYYHRLARKFLAHLRSALPSEEN